MIYPVRNALISAINIIMGVVDLIIGLRVIFKLFAVNSGTPIVAWTNQLSSSLIYPFRGLLPDFAISTMNYVDVTAMIAMFTYSVLAYLLVLLIDSAIPKTTVVKERVREEHVV